MTIEKKYKAQRDKKQAKAGGTVARAVASPLGGAVRTAHNGAERTAQLTLIATPIGNASDITLRALETFAAADIIFCEDTRQTQKLLGIHGITGKKLVAAHQHNEEKAAQLMLSEILAGKHVAYASDAGLPLISDPGETIVKLLVEAGVTITSLPGANAALTALQLSGLPAIPFYFAGFLPPKTKARQDALNALGKIPATLIFYEAPHRLDETLADMLHVLGNRKAAYARELTKRFEDIQRGALSDLCAYVQEKERIRGECVIVIAPQGANDEVGESANELDDLLYQALKTLSPRDAAFDVAAKTGQPRRALYQRILELKK